LMHGSALPCIRPVAYRTFGRRKGQRPEREHCHQE
jgi:hypothetical protein